jgi:hypothetical protein
MGHRKASPDGLQLACRGPGAGHAPGEGPKVVDGTGAGVVAAPAVVALGGLGRCGSLLARADLVRWLRHHRRRCRGRARDEVVEGGDDGPGAEEEDPKLLEVEEEGVEEVAGPGKREEGWGEEVIDEGGIVALEGIGLEVGGDLITAEGPGEGEEVQGEEVVDDGWSRR